MLKAAIILSAENQERIYPPAVRKELDALCEVVVEGTPADLPDHREALREVSILFSGWGAPRMDAETLECFPQLKLFLYGAGSLKGTLTDAFWDTGIPVCSAWKANAVPVAEFTFAQIILALKQVHRMPGLMRTARGRAFPEVFHGGGAFGTTVSLISLGEIGRMVAGFLQQLEVQVIAYDPFCDPDAASALGVELVSLEHAFSRARVVSLHTPWLKETEGMITGDLLRMIPPGGTFLNTARGAVVREHEMIGVLRERPDLTALLDVTHPEPPPPESPLYDLPNVFLTPHIAGSIHGECGRMGQYMVGELRRWLKGEALQHRVSREAFLHMA